MPGNDTIVVQPRSFLPAIWGRADFAAGQTTALALAINGFPAGIDTFSLHQRSSLVAVGVELDAAVTAGFIRFQLTINGSAIGSTFDMDSGTGLRRLIEVPSGKYVGQKGNRVGVEWGSPPSLAPAGIDGIVAILVEPA